MIERIKHVRRLYRMDGDVEFCFNIGLSDTITNEQVDKLRKILADGFAIDTVTHKSQLEGGQLNMHELVEVGPRKNFATAWSSNMVSICQATGLESVVRMERSRRYIVPEGVDVQTFIDAHHDRMTEEYYPESLRTFDTGIEPEQVYEVDMIFGGPNILEDIPGISMDEWDRRFYYDYFVMQNNRNPTIVEIMDLNNANSEHSRHGYFGGKLVIDGQEQNGTLFDLVKETLVKHPKGSVVSFKDNSSVITGSNVQLIIPDNPGQASAFSEHNLVYHLMFTAETHNFPTGVAPFPGAETGTGGRIRDIQGTGKGGFVIAGTAGYCVANLHIPGYDLPWETKDFKYPDNLARALQIEIEASDGASDYGNKFGEPLIQGFTRAFDMRLPGGERWGFLKPIMFTGGIGQIDARHTEKDAGKKGTLIVQVGGPAYRVGFGGGAASSMIQGQQDAKLDFNAVQRGDGEMEQKMNRVIRACNEMGDKTLIDVIHDQGAGGPANVLKELVEDCGGWIDIRKINVGDPTMSVLEIYVAEFQERNGFLISPENIEQFQAICDREKVGCEVLGEVTGDLQFVVRDSYDNTTPVDLDLSKVLGGMPQKTFEDNHVPMKLEPFVFPDGVTVRSALHDVLRLVSVGSKRFLTNKVDRSVGGLIAQQQCVGPLQLPLADVAVVAQSHFGLTGGATAIGEQAIKMIVDPAAGARMTVGEALTNLMWAGGIDLEQVKCSANWMWAPKLPGEGAALSDAARAMCEAMEVIGIAVDGGKDSMSMATIVGDETVKSPRELVISLYAQIDDVTRVVAPDIKQPGDSQFIYIDISDGRTRLGGSALAHVYGQIGSEIPDMDNPELMRNVFLAIQDMIDKDWILSGHDVSDGGLITTMLEMAFAGNCGLDISIPSYKSALELLFAEELGILIECANNKINDVYNLICNHGAHHGGAYIIGKTTVEKNISIVQGDDIVLFEDMRVLRQEWEATSYQLERLQKNPVCADAEKENIFDRPGPKYRIPFTPKPTSPEILEATDKPKVAILREEGSNSDREMTSAFYLAGFEPWDITMTDLLNGKISLDQFRGLAAVGGFSYADVPESAKGWAATIKFNGELKEIFTEFYERPDTFSLGICNGCQLFGLLGWIPWRGISPENQPRFVHNDSGKFESRWSTVRILSSKAMMFDGMDNLVFGVNVAHGEGKFYPSDTMWNEMNEARVLAAAFVDDYGRVTEKYPFNPNGSRHGVTAVCSKDGRHLAMMPHPERTVLSWQCHYLPEDMKRELHANDHVSPWLEMFKNAYKWCQQN